MINTAPTVSYVLVDALDFFEDSTVPVAQWLANGDARRHEDYIKACVVYAANPYADGRLRGQPHVAYDAVSDTHFFIFKQDNNGLCILVGKRLPRFPAESLL